MQYLLPCASGADPARRRALLSAGGFSAAPSWAASSLHVARDFGSLPLQAHFAFGHKGPAGRLPVAWATLAGLFWFGCVICISRVHATFKRVMPSGKGITDSAWYVKKHLSNQEQQLLPVQCVVRPEML